ncbi:NUDIX hydrolase [Huintestinicola sp.]|uniref:NUDIX hydrolase n=1 Tax=Huintestinicola sp. TaxID=2981661 RepID=UPI003D7C9C07
MQGNTDCCFCSGNDWFRYRVGAIIISGEYALFAYSEVDKYYYSVGGGVHVGEHSRDAVLRETMEETGLELEIERPLCIVENFFYGTGSLDGLNCHALELYYLMKPAEKKEITVSSFTANGMVEKMRWLPISRLDDYDIRPKTAVRLAKEPPVGFEVFVNEER